MTARKHFALLVAINCAVATGVLLGINEWLHPGTMNGWISAAAFATFTCGQALGYGVGLIHGSKEPK
jgi:hypothetical protein